MTDDIGPHDMVPGRCKYISGDPKGEWHYCQERTVGNTSWCAHHLSVVYRSDEREDAA